MAKKKRHIFLLTKHQQGKSLSQKELLELKGYDSGMSKNYVDNPESVAKLFGVSKRTVFRWIEDGLPREKDGRFNLPEIQLWHSSRKNVRKQGAVKDPDRINWEERYRKAKALREERRNAIEAGKLVTIKEVEAGLVQILTALKQAILRLPYIFAARLANQDERTILKDSTDLCNSFIKMIAEDRLFKQRSIKTEGIIPEKSYKIWSCEKED